MLYDTWVPDSTVLYADPIATAARKTGNLEEKVKTNIQRHDEVMIYADNAAVIDPINSQDGNIIWCSY